MKLRIILGLSLLLVGGGLIWKLERLVDERDSAQEEAKKWEATSQNLSEVLEVEREESLLVQGEVAGYRERINELESIEKEVVVEVTEYVLDTEVPECGVDSEWLRLYNKSGGSRMSEAPGPAPGTNGEPERVYPAQSIIGIVTQNNMVCEKEKEKLASLQNIIKKIYSARGQSYTF